MFEGSLTTLQMKRKHELEPAEFHLLSSHSLKLAFSRFFFSLNVLSLLIFPLYFLK